MSGELPKKVPGTQPETLRETLPKTLPKTLPEQIFLLACDLHRHRARRGDMAVAVRGAVIAELSLRDCLVEEDGTVRASSTRRTGNAVLDNTLHTMSEQRPRSWRGWIRRDTWQTTCAVQRQLARDGLITVEPERILGLFPNSRVTVRDPGQVLALRDAVRAIVHGDQPVPDRSASLVALVSAGEVRSLLSRKDRRTNAARIAELSEQGSRAVPALRRVLRQIKAARVAAYGGGG